MNRPDKEPGNGASQSPRFFRRKFAAQVSQESTSTSQGKVVLGEVEQKLKSMRQKRLDRLSTFVVEQSKLSEERDIKNKEGTEIEDAIMSMKQAKEEKKTPFKSIVEEQVIERKEVVEVAAKEKPIPPWTPKLSRKSSNEFGEKSKQSSTKKFINRLNCTTTQSVGSSVEDLTADYEDAKSIPATVRLNSNKPPVLKRTSFEENKNIVEEKTAVNRTENNPLLSPVGKQRKGVYLYDRECNFLDNEKSVAMPAVSSFAKRENDGQEIITKSLERINFGLKKALPSNAAKETFVRKAVSNKTASDTNLNVQEDAAKSVILEVKTRNSYESRSTVASKDKPPLSMKTFKRNSLGDILDGKLVNKLNYNPVSVDESPSIDSNVYQYTKKAEVTNQQGYAKISKYSNLNNYKNIELQFQQNEIEKRTVNYNEVPSREKIHKDNYPTPPKSPMPLPRRFSNEEKILKKFQRNWDSLNEITENDSDVDSDEIEDLKKTFQEVNELLIEYCTKLNRLERKSKADDDYHKKLNVIKDELETIEEDITKFKGLRRDFSYNHLNNKLSNCLTNINKVKSSKTDVHSEKLIILKQAENLIKILEGVVRRNEDMLVEVLEAQVASIGTNIFSITHV